jgi:pyruvate dehydrogenase E2 component (dihydrolipoamide acetyltransferase)
MVPCSRGRSPEHRRDRQRDSSGSAPRLKAGKVQKEDLGGSSFTIHSLGKLGGLMAPAHHQLPRGRHHGRPRHQAKAGRQGDQIVIGDVMLLSFSFDHRIIDGDVGAVFAQKIVSYLEEPDRLLVEMS